MTKMFVFTLHLKVDVKVTNVLCKSESVKFSLIEPVIFIFTDSSVQKYYSLSNQLIFTD